MEVSKDSKQTRRALAGLSELLPRHAHHTRTGIHHTKPSPGREKKGDLLSISQQPLRTPQLARSAHRGGRKADRKPTAPRRKGWHFLG